MSPLFQVKTPKIAISKRPMLKNLQFIGEDCSSRWWVYWDVEAAGDRLRILMWTIEQRPQMAGNIWRGRGSDHRPPAPAAV